MENILIIGASGQIGSELTMALREQYGNTRVYATDIKQPPDDVLESGPFQVLDVMDDKSLIHFVIRHKITQIYHLAAVLSGNAEKIPSQAWKINMDALMNILDLTKEVDEIKKVFWPSSIAVFGPSTPAQNTGYCIPYFAFCWIWFLLKQLDCSQDLTRSAVATLDCSGFNESLLQRMKTHGWLPALDRVFSKGFDCSDLVTTCLGS